MIIKSLRKVLVVLGDMDVGMAVGANKKTGYGNFYFKRMNPAPTTKEAVEQEYEKDWYKFQRDSSACIVFKDVSEVEKMIERLYLLKLSMRNWSVQPKEGD